jgi:hypothetical protein
MMRRWRHPLVIALTVAICLSAAIAAAQFGRRGFGGFRSFGANFATAKDFDGHFHFCRWVYQSALDGDGGNWNADWPRADINLSIRLSELTKADVSKNPQGEPNHLLIRFTDPEVFDCPFVMGTEVGRTFITDEEAKAMRLYLEKGGFLWVDDFWGSYAWDHWVAQIRKALPANEFPIFDLPLDHPLFHTQFEVKEVTQISNIGFYLSTHTTSERGPDSAVAHARGVADKSGRLMVLMTHNTDFGDSYEREGDSPEYFVAFGPKGYAFGINAILYALTH